MGAYAGAIRTCVKKSAEPRHVKCGSLMKWPNLSRDGKSRHQPNFYYRLVDSRAVTS